MSKNVILADYDVDDNWDFKIAIERSTGEKWTIIKSVTNRYQGNAVKVMIRYIRSFTFAFRRFLKRNKYNKVFAWQQFYGLILAFYCRLFKVKKYPDIYIMTFIYKPKKSKLFNKLIRYSATSKYIKKLIVLSESEKKYYSELLGISEDKFFCTRIGVTDVSKKVTIKNDSEKYYLSVGRSNRDYAFLRENWKKEYGKLVIICDSYDQPEKDGIVCLRNCYGADYMDMVANCYADIVSLDDPNISSGSLSFLQAMMLSKPTIVTENKTVHDYIVNGENGFVIPKEASALDNAIKKLDDPAIYKAVTERARADYENKFSEFALGDHLGKMIKAESND